jgi:eukaryotic translation initiation factor 2C
MYHQVLQYGQSQYVNQFGMNVSNTLVDLEARVIKPPMLKYNPTSKQPNIVCTAHLSLMTKSVHFPNSNRAMVPGICELRGSEPALSNNNMHLRRLDKKMFKSAEVLNWVVLVYERPHCFRQEALRQMVTELVKACVAVGKAIQPSSTVTSRTKS